MDRVQYEQSEGLDNGFLFYPARCVFRYADRIVRHRDRDACRQVEGVCQARHAGWYSLIPVFSDYKLCERVRGGEENKTFLMAYLIVLICSWVLCWAPAVNWILIIAQFVMNIIVLNDLARTFGKESAYTIGLVLLGIVFWPMLGFGESEPVDTEDDSDTDYEVL